MIKDVDAYKIGKENGFNVSSAKQYYSQNDSTFDQIKQTFPDSMLNDIPGHGLIVKEGVDLGSYSRYYKSGYTSSDGIKYLIYKQWTIVNIQNIIEFAKKQGWSVDKL